MEFTEEDIEALLHKEDFIRYREKMLAKKRTLGGRYIAVPAGFIEEKKDKRLSKKQLKQAIENQKECQREQFLNNLDGGRSAQQGTREYNERAEATEECTRSMRSMMKAPKNRGFSGP